MKKILLTLLGATLVLTGCNSGTSSSTSPNGFSSAKSSKVASSSDLIKAAYVDMGAIGAYDAIPTAGFAKANVVIFGFANVTSSSMTATQIAQIKKAMSAEQSGTVNLLSIGGELATPATFNQSSIQQIANNVIAQINSFNSQNSTKIDGVDLDLEAGIDGATVAGLADLFKKQGLKVGAAPQVYLSGGTNIDSTAPSNLVLTSGGGGTSSDLSRVNVYQSALNSGDIDYLFVQTYNTSGFTIDQADEASVDFFKNTAKALSTSVKSECSGTSICVPSTTKIVIGTVANKYAGWYTPFQNNATAADQQATLAKLKANIDSMVGDEAYSNFAGTMVWSLNMDYAASLYSSSNTAYSSGAFATTIFSNSEPTPTPTKPYFILQVTNNAPDVANNYAYASVSLAVNGDYWIFGNQWSQPISPQLNQQWGTLASSQDVSGVIDSSNLDNIFSNGNTSFTATVQVNGYKTNGNINSPTGSFTCKSNPTYTFEAGHSYNIIVNATDNSNGAAACVVQQVN